MSAKNTIIYHLQQMTDEQKHTVSVAIKNGASAILPTDTVYGLVTAAATAKAADKLNAIKNNPPGKPTQILCTLNQSQVLAQPSTHLDKLTAAFWPGNLTIITQTTPLGSALQGGLKTIGLRMPADTITQYIMQQSGLPLFASSANMHGHSVCEGELCVIEYFSGRVDIIILDGDIKTQSSTVVDITGDAINIIRAGQISTAALKEVLK